MTTETCFSLRLSSLSEEGGVQNSIETCLLAIPCDDNRAPISSLSVCLSFKTVFKFSRCSLPIDPGVSNRLPQSLACYSHYFFVLQFVITHVDAGCSAPCAVPGAG